LRQGACGAVQYTAFKNEFLLAISNERGCKGFHFAHRHASEAANMFFTAHRRAARETEDTMVYTLSLRMSFFQYYYYTQYPLTCLTCKSSMDQIQQT
jgi:LmbE family N-acetylglucosaminyl deacetylase